MIVVVMLVTVQSDVESSRVRRVPALSGKFGTVELVTAQMPLEEATSLAYRRLVSVGSNARQVNPAMEDLARRILTTGLFEAADLLDRAVPADDALAASQVRMVVSVLRCLEHRAPRILLHEVATTADALAYASEALGHPQRRCHAALRMHMALGPGQSVYRDAAAASGWPPVRAFAAASLVELMAAQDIDVRSALDLAASLDVRPDGRPAQWASGHVEETLTWLGSLTSAQLETAAALAAEWTGTLGALHSAAKALV